MNGEIVSVATADHVRLHGFYRAAESASRDGSPQPAVILIHGLGGNFYSSRLLNYLADSFVEHGVHSVIVNTRGHDTISTLSQSGRALTGGATYESVGDCTYDLRAWAEWIKSQTSGPVILLGHSLGAIKALYTQAEQPIDNVAALIALSATRLNHQALLDSAGGDQFRHWFALASKRVDEGRANELLSVDFPFPTWMTAGAYREKYGPKNRYDWFRFVDAIQNDSLLVFGERELSGSPAFEGLRDDLSGRLANHPSVETSIIAGANHFYVGKFAEVWETIRDWLIRETALLT